MRTPRAAPRNALTARSTSRVTELTRSGTPIGLGTRRAGYVGAMLYTILIILAIIALALFILGRR